MNRLRRVSHKDGSPIGYTHWCPACDSYHDLYVEEPNPTTHARWTFNGDMENPSFSPSIRCGPCHYKIENGMLVYYPDCEHPYAGVAIEMPKGDIR